MESRFGHDFSGVEVHTDSRAAESARAVNALAYTVGRNVVFDSGRYVPQTQAGRKLMAHELTHVVQQSQHSQNVMRKGLEVGSPDTTFERQADSMAEQVMKGSTRPVRGIKRSGSILQRACGPTAIGQPSGCEFQETDVIGPETYLFRINCDEFAEGNERNLRAEAQNIQAGEIVEIHGLASSDRQHDFNVNLACARALRARGVIEQVLLQRGVTATIRVINHGPQAGTALKRSVLIIRSTPQTPGPIIPAPAPTRPTPLVPGCKTPTNPDRSGSAFNPTTVDEFTVAKNHPYDASIGWLDSKMAISAAGSSGLDGPHFGPFDAFRHCVWNCLMTKDLGATRAEQFATGHENSGPSAVPHDNEMDLHNNSTGRSLGAPGVDCETVCTNALTSGQLRTIRGPNTVPTWCIGASDQPWP
jgi:hypothetical protein